jgi:hypothetical protein
MTENRLTHKNSDSPTVDEMGVTYRVAATSANLFAVSSPCRSAAALLGWRRNRTTLGVIVDFRAGVAKGPAG